MLGPWSARHLAGATYSEAREIRDAEETEPGVVRRALDEAIKNGEEPTRAKVKRATKAKAKSEEESVVFTTSRPAQPKHNTTAICRCCSGYGVGLCQRKDFSATVVGRRPVALAGKIGGVVA